MRSLPPSAPTTALLSALLAFGMGGGAAQAAQMAQAAQAAQMLSPGLMAQMDKLARDSAAKSGWKHSRVEVELGQLDPRLKLAPCQRIEPYLPPGLPAWGRTRIGIKCTEGLKAWNVTMPMTVKIWARSLVTTGALPAGTPLQASQMMEADVDLAAAPGEVIDKPADVVGRQLVRPLPPGTALRVPDLKARQWFNAGETVRVTAVGSGWSIVAEGQALGPGIEGQSTRVRMESGHLIQARPVGDRQVEISL